MQYEYNYENGYELDFNYTNDEHIWSETVIDEIVFPNDIILGWYANNSLESLIKCKSVDERVNLAINMIKYYDNEINNFINRMKETNNHNKKNEIDSWIDERLEGLSVYAYYYEKIKKESWKSVLYDNK